MKTSTRIEELVATGTVATARAATPKPQSAVGGTSKLAVIGLTVGLTGLVAGGAGYLAGRREVQAPRLPAMVVEVPTSALEPAPEVATSGEPSAPTRPPPPSTPLARSIRRPAPADNRALPLPIRHSTMTGE
jgi:hypothetical protein